MTSRLIYPTLLALLLAVVYGESCLEHSDCSPMFSCVEGRCFCRFGPALPCAPSIFRFVPLNQIPLKKFNTVKKFHGYR